MYVSFLPRCPHPPAPPTPQQGDARIQGLLFSSLLFALIPPLYLNFPVCFFCRAAPTHPRLSKEMRVFKAALAALERGDRPNPDLKPFGVDFQGEEKQIRDWGLEEAAADDEHRER